MDTLNAVRDAKAKGATILSVLNVLGSTLMRLSTVYIDQNSGPEIASARPVGQADRDVDQDQVEAFRQDFSERGRDESAGIRRDYPSCAAAVDAC